MPLPWRKPAPPPAAADATGDDWVVTDGFLDTSDIAKHLDRLDPDTAGLALFFIEQMPMIADSIAQVNALNDAPKDRDALLNALYGLLNTLGETMLVTKALLHGPTRDTLHKTLYGPDAPTSPAARQAALNTLFHTTFPDAMPAPADQDAPGLENVGSQFAGEFRFAIDSFDVLTIIPTPNKTRWPFVLPAAMIGVFAILVITSGYVREQIFGKPSGVVCTTVIAGDGASQVTCSHTAPTLADGIAAGQALGMQ